MKMARKRKRNDGPRPKKISRVRFFTIVGSIVAGTTVGMLYLGNDETPQEIILEAAPEPVTLETLTRNYDFHIFRLDAGPVESNPTILPELEKACKDESIDPKKLSKVTYEQKKEISLLPHTDYFRELEKRLNQEIAEFSKLFPEGMKKPHKVALLTKKDNLQELPYEKEGIVQMYFVNAVLDTNTFEGMKGSRPFKLLHKTGAGGSASLGVHMDNRANQIKLKFTPDKVLIAPALDMKGPLRYEGVVHTVLSEYLHSILGDTKERHITGLLNAMKSRDQLSWKVINHIMKKVEEKEEGVVHTAVLTYQLLRGADQEMIDHHLRFFKQHGKKGDTRYRHVNEYYDAINGAHYWGRTLDRNDARIDTIIKFWHNANLGVLKDGKSVIYAIQENIKEQRASKAGNFK